MPTAGKLLALEREFEMALLEAILRVAFRLPRPAIPDNDRAAPIFAFRDRSLEVAIVERMVLDNLLPKLSQEQRYQAQALIAGGAGGLSHALRYAGGCVPLDLVSKEICDVVDFILTARNATAANA